mmetsp:Transcript_34850/g.87672  ORF Transcript_34850/g.87672 Transcript_34850/m.87672 type:complete len:418 (+) Transcript_34850:125-1378(+)|eukprot:CAMPEP_0177648646 /NCGR_PEP_ID=MMETSP0447-20121125/10936_1 /TAXON_ID=0 /ORGANISM="Stygamoeba regulata, Strain BSH-02190019" /LENGTH=417 /DNA_ID=CAMNT_0019151295 /DNA_START=102 /DNA_END=1355 /DNA_ORIENTATION=-
MASDVAPAAALAAAASAKRKVKKKALLVHGLDDGMSDEVGKDVADMERSLTRLGFKVDTTQGRPSEILAKLRNIRQNFCRDGNVFVFYFSGHGNQVADQVGDGADEADGLDEVLQCFWDDKGKRNIRDDEFYNIFGDLRGDEANVTFILDCCHSGTGVRAVKNKAEGRVFSAAFNELDAAQKLQRLKDQETPMYINLISASRADETSAANGQYGSNLTHALVDIMNKGVEGLTYIGVMEELYNEYFGNPTWLSKVKAGKKFGICGARLTPHHPRLHMHPCKWDWHFLESPPGSAHFEEQMEKVMKGDEDLIDSTFHGDQAYVYDKSISKDKYGVALRGLGGPAGACVPSSISTLTALFSKYCSFEPGEVEGLADRLQAGGVVCLRDVRARARAGQGRPQGVPIGVWNFLAEVAVRVS